MNTTDPADIHALPYGCGLAIGLLLILGLPAAPKPTPEDPSTNRPRISRRLADSPARVEPPRVILSV